ncbi:hypothetical protein A4A49_00610 [Nicotiana attenuata]|uniref:Uncharacterized protein n=1 Tax=Nicotiana attenuata TaxID=49451 RepID=A0A314L880_NICAT|nr:hypothetical protein A4A49_00610 [Nicotiana attenuata]
MFLSLSFAPFVVYLDVGVLHFLCLLICFVPIILLHIELILVVYFGSYASLSGWQNSIVFDQLVPLKQK